MGRRAGPAIPSARELGVHPARRLSRPGAAIKPAAAADPEATAVGAATLAQRDSYRRDATGTAAQVSARPAPRRRSAAPRPGSATARAARKGAWGRPDPVDSERAVARHGPARPPRGHRLPVRPAGEHVGHAFTRESLRCGDRGAIPCRLRKVGGRRQFPAVPSKRRAGRVGSEPPANHARTQRHRLRRGDPAGVGRRHRHLVERIRAVGSQGVEHRLAPVAARQWVHVLIVVQDDVPGDRGTAEGTILVVLGIRLERDRVTHTERRMSQGARTVSTGGAFPDPITRSAVADAPSESVTVSRARNRPGYV